MYAGQNKIAKDIEKALKREIGRAKSNAKKASRKSEFYYATLLHKNKLNKDK